MCICMHVYMTTAGAPFCPCMVFHRMSRTPSAAGVYGVGFSLYVAVGVILVFHTVVVYINCACTCSLIGSAELRAQHEACAQRTAQHVDCKWTVPCMMTGNLHQGGLGLVWCATGKIC